MMIPEMLARLTLGPVELFFDAVCSLSERLTGSPGLSLLCLGLAVGLLLRPLCRKRAPADAGDPESVFRRVMRPLMQAGSIAASVRFFSSLKALRGVSFGLLGDLGQPDGLLGAGAEIHLLPVLAAAAFLASEMIRLHGESLPRRLLSGGFTALFAALLNDRPSGLALFWLAAGMVTLLCRWADIGARPMKLNSRQAKTDRGNRILLGLCFLYMAILTGLLIPSEILKASPAEFVDAHYYRDPAQYLVSSSLLAAGTFLLWGGGYGLLLSPKGRKHFVLGAGILAAVSAVDYMFFGKDYGFISSALQFEASISNHTGNVLINAGAVLLTAGAVWLVRNKKPVILRIVCLYGCAALTVMSVTNISSMEAEAKQVKAVTARISTEKPSFRLSRKGKNVVVIMLDRAISGFVPFIMNEKPELLRQFDGFTWYPNTLSYGYHTNIASPPLFGGYEYTPDGMEARSGLTLKEKHNEALKVMPLNFLRSGFEVTVCDAPYANYQWIPDLSIYDDTPEIRTFNTIGMFDEYREQILANLDRNRNRNLYFYSLFRSAPLLLQETLYDRGRYLEMDAGADATEGSELIGISPDFLSSYMVMKNLGTMTEVTEEGPDAFLMLTNEMTHEAVELQEPDYVPRNDADNTVWDAEHGIRRTADGRELDLPGSKELVRTHYHVDMAAFIQLGNWFDELRAQGVWDNTRIILVSDHGCYLGLFGTDLTARDPQAAGAGYIPEEWSDTMCYNPLLMVKDFGTAGFTTDNSFMTNADTPSLAFEGVVDSPVNPFTGKPVTTGAKQDPEQHVVESDWHIVLNCGNTFSNPLRITLRNQDIFRPENWSVAH